MTNVPILDYAFLAFETEESPKHVAGLQIFDLPAGATDDFVADLVEQAKLVRPTWPFNQRLQVPLIGMPQWIEDRDIDLDDHVFYESVPSPKTGAALLERIADLHAEPLERSGALWELYFFEHLEPRRFAVYFKVHHAYMDGISLSKRAMTALGTDSDAQRPVAFWGSDPTETQAVRRDILGALFHTARSAGRAALVLPALARLGLKHGLRLLHLGGGTLPVPFTAPRTAFNTPLTAERSIAVTDMPLERVHAIAHLADVTVNDVILAICDAAMTRYLAVRGGEPQRPLVAQMPISLRHEDGGQGNQITIALLELGRDASDPVERLRAVHEHAREVKEEYTGMTVEAAEAYTVLMQCAAQFGETLGLGAYVPPLGNVVISNVIGPRERLYLNGAPLVATYPLSAIAPLLAMNITIYSYAGTLHVGIVAGRLAIPDLEPIVAEMHSALDALETALNPESTAVKPSVPKPARAPAGVKKRAKRTQKVARRAAAKGATIAPQRSVPTEKGAE